MTPLPIDPFLPQIIQRVRESRALVLVAEPGAGKTTRVPPAILASNLLSRENPNIVMLQPRRVAARAAAMRIAQENHWQIGQEVGWHVRMDKRVGPRTRIRVVTEGILTRQLVDDPFLEGIGAVILDEFHERSIHTDLAISLLREVRQTVRSDLILLVMSATLDAKPVADFLGGCPIASVPGRTFPIDIQYARFPSGDPLPLRIDTALSSITDETGDVLIFLPGVRQINETARQLSHFKDSIILPLHGSLTPEQQMRALEPADRRKIILATNIAETSLTIDGVRTVIDSGVARVAGYDAERGLDRLDLAQISKASARQRAGRAGRTAPGRCVRLYTEKEFHALDDFELPEIRRIDLAGTVLTLHGWGKSDVRAFGWYESPPDQMIDAAEQLLEMLGALENGTITVLGRQILTLPLHPRLARLLIGAAKHSLLQEGAAIAALLSERDFPPSDSSPQSHSSDLLVRLGRIKSIPQIAQVRDELVLIGKSIRPLPPLPRVQGRGDSETGELLLRLILIAYPDRVCRRRGKDPSAAVMVGGGGVKLATESVVKRHEFFVAVDARADDRNPRNEALVRIASGIEPAWLEEFFPHEICKERKLVFDSDRQRVVGHGTIKYRDLILREDRDAPVDAEEAGKILAQALRPLAAERIAKIPEAANFLARLDLLKQFMPEHPWPDIDETSILEEMCRGLRSVEQLDRVSPIPILESQLTYPLDRLFEQHAPQSIEVPTGNKIRIDYAKGQSPVLAVRLQELFGWTQTPRIAGGRVPLVVHLLGPNYRPVQVTDDLGSFWKTTYFQVRKDLRVRYPKHSWPEDPLTAPPQAKGGRRR
ncbi:MAG TPA: ATP-dependent helicase HrpB [Tepidisphaeraceae bacterium]|nr:ATP-dependent helicase HrpB [Tepidisphaeraceae bacterium]